VDVITTTIITIVWLTTVVAETVVLTVIRDATRAGSSLTLKPLKQPSALLARSSFTITPRDDA
jgi:hypothetical protein